MSLEYPRQYRTYFHMGKHYGFSESTAYKTIRWVEDTLINMNQSIASISTTPITYKLKILNILNVPVG